MSEIKRNPKRCPTHPGKVLRIKVLPALGVSKTKIAEDLGVSRQTLHDILAERQPVTPQMAVRIGKLCGNGPEIWLNMQQAYDLWHAEREVNTKKIPTYENQELAG